MIPQFVDVRKLVTHQGVLAGEVPVAALGRLQALVANQELVSLDSVVVNLQFGQDLERRRVVTGEVRAQVHMVCQRCLEPMSVALSAEVHWALVYNQEQADKLPNRWDPWFVEPDTLSDVCGMIEEELLLAMPCAPVHDEPCQLHALALPEIPDAAPAAPNPFSALTALKGKLIN
jgi:uncharacterized protein